MEIYAFFPPRSTFWHVEDILRILEIEAQFVIVKKKIKNVKRKENNGKEKEKLRAKRKRVKGKKRKECTVRKDKRKR